MRQWALHGPCIQFHTLIFWFYYLEVIYFELSLLGVFVTMYLVYLITSESTVPYISSNTSGWLYIRWCRFITLKTESTSVVFPSYTGHSISIAIVNVSIVHFATIGCYLITKLLSILCWAKTYMLDIQYHHIEDSILPYRPLQSILASL